MNNITKVKQQSTRKLKSEKYTSDSTLIYLIPAIFTLLVIPLVVYMNIIPIDSVTFPFWTGQNENVDFFSYTKVFLIKIAAIASIAAFIAASFRNQLTIKPLKKYYIPVALYALFVILSTIFSQYKAIAVIGFVDRYEGVYAILSYLILMLLAICFVNREGYVKIMLGALLLSAVAIGVIGVLQFTGYDLLSTDYVRKFTIPAKFHYLTQFIRSKFDKYTICSTLYNTNYVGSYMAMLFPITLTLTILIRKNIYKVGMGLITCLMLVNLVGCRSRAGLAGGAVAVLIMLVIVRRKLIPNLKYIIPAICAFVAIFIVLNNQSNGEILKRLTPEKLFSKNLSSTAAGSLNSELKDISIDGFKASIITTKNTINLELINNQLKFTDKDGQYLMMNIDKSGKITAIDKVYSDYYFNVSQNKFINVAFQDMYFKFYIGEDALGIVGERDIVFNTIDKPERVLFDGMERFASSRGYIWSRSIPLLKKTMLIGSGPDTFAFLFPQHDFVGKIIAFGTTNEIVDKPHNMYLQMGVNTGVVSMLAVLALFVIYFISCMKLYLKGKFTNGTEIMGAAIFTGFIGYAIAGFINDSIVSVAPVFWILLGMGIALNYMLTRSEDKKYNEIPEGK